MTSTMRFENWENTLQNKSVSIDQSVAIISGVASAAARNAVYPSPVQGNTVYRSDLGAFETYYGLYSVSNPGGKAMAGWYASQNGGMVPLTPTSVDTTGNSDRTATYTSTGFVSFTGCLTVTLNGILNDAKYKSYRFVVNHTVSGGDNLYMRTTNAGVPGGTYFRSGMLWYTNSTGSYWAGYGEDRAYLVPCGTANAFSVTGDFTPGGGLHVMGTGQTTGGTLNGSALTTYFAANGDGLLFGLSNSAGRWSGNIQVFGYRG